MYIYYIISYCNKQEKNDYGIKVFFNNIKPHKKLDRNRKIDKKLK